MDGVNEWGNKRVLKCMQQGRQKCLRLHGHPPSSPQLNRLPFAQGALNETLQTPIQPLLIYSGTHLTPPRCRQEGRVHFILLLRNTDKTFTLSILNTIVWSSPEETSKLKFLSPLILPLCCNRNAPFSIPKGPLASQSSRCVAPLEADGQTDGGPGEVLGPLKALRLGIISLLAGQTQPALVFHLFRVCARSLTLVLKNFAPLPRPFFLLHVGTF